MRYQEIVSMLDACFVSRMSSYYFHSFFDSNLKLPISHCSAMVTNLAPIRTEVDNFVSVTITADIKLFQRYYAIEPR